VSHDETQFSQLAGMLSRQHLLTSRAGGTLLEHFSGSGSAESGHLCSDTLERRGIKALVSLQNS
jgi:hypothetical protein